MMAAEGTAVPGEGTAPAEDLAGAALSLARRFASGATMWCVSPEWPAHGRHVAVEFIHPVIVGTRALPAVHVEGVDVAGALRGLVRPGDVLLAVSSSDDPVTNDLMRRGDAWGLTRIWLGAGARPAPGLCDHVVWMEGVEPARAARTGDMVVLYHLLWELTHVVFEHPGLLVPESVCMEAVCITCSDEGRAAEVRALVDQDTATVVVGGLVESVDVSLVDPVTPGDLVLVHAGVALSILHRTVLPESWGRPAGSPLPLVSPAGLEESRR